MSPRHDIPFAWYWQGRPLRNRLRPLYTGPEPCCHDIQDQSRSQTVTPARARGKEPCIHDPYCPSSSADRADDPGPGPEAGAEAEAEAEPSCSLCTAGPSSIQYHAHTYFYPSSNPNPSAHYDYDDFVFCPCPDCQGFMSCCQCPDCRPEYRPDYPRHRRFDDRRRADRDEHYGYQRGSHGSGQSYAPGHGSGQGNARVRVRPRTPAPAPASVPDTDSDSVTTGRPECEEECCRYPLFSSRNRRV